MRLYTPGDGVASLDIYPADQIGLSSCFSPCSTVQLCAAYPAVDLQLFHANHGDLRWGSKVPCPGWCTGNVSERVKENEVGLRDTCAKLI
jgi:hypothetical protein